ncbi:Rne/Rng family ribonuclease [Hellea balneolensis]|uniref:Rne/Rng family ribonuclease n=1 Tax=Hellea balneolensis TaxID=287478 RepID=UPI0012B876AB|nr:ribonuclease E/G [Hellea balneolensis]
MTKKMLIDASHPEETRVVIVDGNRVEELDFESRNKRQLRGNVYLARVTRVEPSLQAAFVEYGGNRHGFLAFSEIHPDYYQIPHEDKLALLEAEEAAQKEADAEDEDDIHEDGEAEELEADENVDPDSDDVADANDEEVAEEQVKVASSRRKRQSRRRYKIQEVIKRGQILLIQAVKEERGNKGAAMTTYLSLAGRYCVLMPNTARGGGISRKIANGSDRKRLKSVMSELEVPQGMGVIVRTAGAKRTKAEIKRDYEYLSRLWDEIRDTTLKSIAPALIHEEGNLVKRSIRDLYNKEIEEVLIEGDTAYKTAKAFMKMLMPSHAKNVKAYKDDIPLFLRYNVERQIEDSLKSVVQLKSGGYLVIHPTEALVSVDVNSGRSTKERNVERTALKTNTEAAEEVARQMRLRDLAGLIVIDFIDMDEHKNNRAVERVMKNALSRDRARVQTSRISQFGLMEISRQRRRRSLLEGSTAHCEHCEGVGRKRTIESSALAAIRAVEEVGVRGKAKRVRLKVSSDVALYIFNEKRDLLQHVDDTSGLFTELVGDEELIRPSYEIEVIEKSKGDGPDPLEEIEKEFRKQRHEQKKRPKKRDKDEADEDESEDNTESREHDDDGDGEGRKKRRRRRGRRGGRGKRRDENAAQDEAGENTSVDESDADQSDETDAKPKSRRGRRKAPGKQKEEASLEAAEDTAQDEKPKRGRRKAPAKKAKPQAAVEMAEETKPKRGRRKAPTKEAKKEETEPAQSSEKTEDDAPKARSSARRKAPAKKASDEPAKKAATRKRAAKAPEVKESVTKMKSKAPARRKAPGKAAPTEPTEETSKAKTKAPAKKAAPKKKAEEAVAAKAKTPAKRKAPARRKAPVKKAPAKKTAAQKKVAPAAEKTEAKATAKKAPAKRKAPARKKAPTKQDAPKAETPKQTAKKAPAKAAPAKMDEAAASPARRKAPTRKAAAAPEPSISTDPADVKETKPKKTKRNWFGLKKK